MRLVLVVWEDSFGCSSHWEEIDDDCRPKPIVCRSVGWLRYDGPDCKLIIPHVADIPNSDAQQGCGDMSIPAKCIRSIIDLYEPVTASRSN